MNNFCHKV